MSRRLCFIALATVLLLPTTPLLAQDDSWQIPDVGAWLLGLLQLDPSPNVAEKSGGDSSEAPYTPSPEDGDGAPTDEGGMFGEPNG